MRIAIVGASGVLGRALVPLLLQEGHTVRALVRFPQNVPPARNLERLACDLLSADEPNRLPGLLVGCETVIHIATAIPRDPAAPGAWHTNTRLRTEGTRRLLDAALVTGVAYYIQQSIVMAYPDAGDRWLNEATPLDTSPARESLCGPVRTMEGMIRTVPPTQLKWCIERGGAFVGPGTAQDDQIERLQAGTLTVPCDGRSFISPIHVADMAAAIACAVRTQPVNAIFNIVNEPVRQGDYFDHLATLLGVPTPLRDPGTACPPSYRCTNQVARAVLHWAPTHGTYPAPGLKSSRV